ncbi:MAG: radical SAM protein [Lachnospiraceae bacterium]|nr:radical SAM protein [Lachnospiraceae bacterium]
MKMSEMVLLGLKHAKNTFAEDIYLRYRYDMTKPITFYALINERCNAKCLMCNFYRRDKYLDEMTLEEWQRALLSLKKFVGKFSISFSGGEPFLRKDFIDLLEWCNRNGIMAGATTNGSLLNEDNVKKIVSAKPFNINISVDAPNADVHDYLRGVPGLFDSLNKGITHLVKERERQGIYFPITIKPTINALNYQYLPELVEWTKRIGATNLSPQTMNRRTPECDELWIDESALPKFENVINQLIIMKRKGEPIQTSESVLALMPEHFKGVRASRKLSPCLIGLRNFEIGTNGDVYSCGNFASIGNIKEQSARNIWNSPKARRIRNDTVSCEKLCLVTCMSHKKLKDKIKMGLQLMRKN